MASPVVRPAGRWQPVGMSSGAGDTRTDLRREIGHLLGFLALAMLTFFAVIGGAAQDERAVARPANP